MIIVLHNTFGKPVYTIPLIVGTSYSSQNSYIIHILAYAQKYFRRKGNKQETTPEWMYARLYTVKWLSRSCNRNVADVVSESYCCLCQIRRKANKTYAIIRNNGDYQETKRICIVTHDKQCKTKYNFSFTFETNAHYQYHLYVINSMKALQMWTYSDAYATCKNMNVTNEGTVIAQIHMVLYKPRWLDIFFQLRSRRLIFFNLHVSEFIICPFKWRVMFFRTESNIFGWFVVIQELILRRCFKTMESNVKQWLLWGELRVRAKTAFSIISIFMALSAHAMISLIQCLEIYTTLNQW